MVSLLSLEASRSAFSKSVRGSNFIFCLASIQPIGWENDRLVKNSKKKETDHNSALLLINKTLSGIQLMFNLKGFYKDNTENP